MQTKANGHKPTLLRNIFIAVALLETVALFGVAGFFHLRGKATGIITGYEEAAARAYQMGRPLPDTIFETGFFRVAVSSKSSTAQAPFRIRVAVRDRMFNTVLFEHERQVEILR